MSVRLIISIQAAAGKGSELLAAYRDRCLDIAKEPGCLQFEVFQSGLDPDRLTLLEHWEDEAALAVHAEANKNRPGVDPSLRGPGAAGREDYTYNRTR